MKNIIFIGLSVLLMSNLANAFVCTATIGPDELTLNYSYDDEMVRIKFGDRGLIEIPVTEQYDGHANYSLITGKGVALTYSNHFGCIRMVELTSAIRIQGAPYNIGRVNFGTCAGGSTPDDLCRPDHHRQ